MTDFFDYYALQPDACGEGYDRERAMKKAISTVLPKILDDELTERQSICFRYKYLSGKSQQEIADLLRLSQPTVSRHIAAAKEIVNGKLKYCYAALSAALSEYDRQHI